VFGCGFKPPDPGIKSEAHLRFGHVLIKVLVLEPMALESRNCLFDDTNPYYRPWDGLQAAMLPLMSVPINETPNK
jgi:hypothetical protein